MAIEPYDGSSRPDILEKSYPLSDDPVSEGDNHLRLLKTVVKNAYADAQAVDSRVDALELAVASGSVHDAARLGGELPAFYRDADNLNAGIVPMARLSGTYPISITGHAAMADNATNAGHAITATIATDSDKLGGLTLAQVVASAVNTIVPQAFDELSVGIITGNNSWNTMYTFTLTPMARPRMITGTVWGSGTTPVNSLPPLFRIIDETDRYVAGAPVGGSYFDDDWPASTHKWMSLGGCVPAGATQLRLQMQGQSGHTYNKPEVHLLVL